MSYVINGDPVIASYLNVGVSVCSEMVDVRRWAEWKSCAFDVHNVYIMFYLLVSGIMCVCVRDGGGGESGLSVCVCLILNEIIYILSLIRYPAPQISSERTIKILYSVCFVLWGFFFRFLGPDFFHPPSQPFKVEEVGGGRGWRKERKGKKRKWNIRTNQPTCFKQTCCVCWT